MKDHRLLTLLLVCLLPVACSRGQVSPLPTAVSSAANATPAPTATTAATSTQPATLTSPAPPTAPLVPSPLPSPSATATELAQVTIAVPAAWIAAVEVVADRATNWQWHISEQQDPAVALQNGSAQLALLPGEGQLHAGTQPLALAVPFSTDWDSVTLVQAQEIIANGHQLVEVVPWNQLQASQRALYIDGVHVTAPDYPLQQSWHVESAPGYAEAARTLADQLAAVTADQTVQLAAVGDVMLDRALGTVIASGDIAYPFLYVQEWLLSADLTLANVESALGDRGAPVDKSYTFRAPPGAAAALASAGIDVVSLANNHALDFGPEALLQGIELLRAQNLATVGAGADAANAHKPAIVEVNGMTLAILGYANVPVEGSPPYFDTSTWTANENQPGLAWATPGDVAADVSAATAHADHVIVLLHSGYEYVPAPSPEQRAAAYAAIDAGATLVIGHHAHILQGIEFYKEGVIAYGLGNFAFNITGPPETAILRVWLDQRGERAAAVRQLEIVPAVIQGTGQPAPVNGEQAMAIRRQVYSLSAGLR